MKKYVTEFKDALDEVRRWAKLNTAVHSPLDRMERAFGELRRECRLALDKAEEQGKAAVTTHLKAVNLHGQLGAVLQKGNELKRRVRTLHQMMGASFELRAKSQAMTQRQAEEINALRDRHTCETGRAAVPVMVRGKPGEMYVPLELHQRQLTEQAELCHQHIKDVIKLGCDSVSSYQHFLRAYVGKYGPITLDVNELPEQGAVLDVALVLESNAFTGKITLSEERQGHEEA